MYYCQQLHREAVQLKTPLLSLINCFLRLSAAHCLLSRDCTSSTENPSSLPLLKYLVSEPAVGYSINSTSETSRLNVVCNRFCSLTNSRECPPSSKKLSLRPTQIGRAHV